ncbi:MAG: VOC family protein [Bacteriovorax sp.]|nr:VOC family protein [Bacteriovorax sp.]
MAKTLAEVIGDPLVFLENIFSKIADIELKVDNYELDHICYRVQSVSEYKIKKEELSSLGELLIESMVNGRLISTFKLYGPIVYKNRKIFLVELPSPKSMHSYPSGLEHVEFVTKDPLQKIVDRYPQYSFEVFGIHKKINADITLKLGEYCIRFHNQSLEEVINLEKKLNTKLKSRKE